jgi:nicotinamidase-related amidase
MWPDPSDDRPAVALRGRPDPTMLRANPRPEPSVSSTAPLAQSALLVIDVQDSFAARPYWPRRNNPAFEANVAALVDAHRAAGLPVFYFLHTDGDAEFRTDSPHFRLMDFLAPRPDEPVLVKDTRNCFTSTTLQARLVALGVRRLAVTGIQTEQCCETTARLAADLGYAVDFVVDATRTFPIANPDAPDEELPADAVVERTVYALRRRFARVVSTATLVDELAALGGAGRGTVLAA